MELFAEWLKILSKLFIPKRETAGKYVAKPDTIAGSLMDRYDS